MDMDSPEKSADGIKEEDGPPFEKQGPNLHLDKHEQGDESFEPEGEVLNNAMEVYSNQEYPNSPLLHVGAESEELQSPIMKAISADTSSPAKKSEESCIPVEPHLEHNDLESRMGDHGSVVDYESLNRKEEAEGADHVDPPGEFLVNNANETFNNEVKTGDSYSLVHDSLLTADSNNHFELMDDEAFHYQSTKSPTFDDSVSEGLQNVTTNLHSEKAEVNAVTDGGSLNRHTENRADDYASMVVPSENGGMVWENSSLHSPQRTQNASPSPERQFSISAERSPGSQPSPRTHESPMEVRQSPTNGDNKSAPSPGRSRRKRSPTPENHSMGRRRASSRDRSSPSARRKSPSFRDHSSPSARRKSPSLRDHSPSARRKSPTSRDRVSPSARQKSPSLRDRSSPSAKQKSPSGRIAQRDSHHRDGSPRKHLSPSPRRRDSPRRRVRSISRSPVRRRDSPGHRRDNRHRSRSRSPYARDRHRRSPRRRHSPRRRSPPLSHSRRRSPRRPWSPPANRSTGVGKPGNNLFVAGFSYVTTERDLEKKFSRYGRVTDVRIVRDRRSGESRGFGFLSLERDEDADAAIRALDQTEWNGRIVLVEKSKTSSR